MSITSQQLDAIIAASKADILDRNLATAILGGTVAQPERRTRTAKPKAVATKPAPKARTRKPKAEPKAATIDRAPNHAGVMMLSGPATITKGQIRNITGIAERNGEPFTKAELADISKFSMVAASDFYAGLKADYSA